MPDNGYVTIYLQYLKSVASLWVWFDIHVNGIPVLHRHPTHSTLNSFFKELLPVSKGDVVKVTMCTLGNGTVDPYPDQGLWINLIPFKITPPPMVPRVLYGKVWCKNFTIQANNTIPLIVSNKEGSIASYISEVDQNFEFIAPFKCCLNVNPPVMTRMNVGTTTTNSTLMSLNYDNRFGSRMCSTNFPATVMAGFDLRTSFGVLEQGEKFRALIWGDYKVDCRFDYWWDSPWSAANNFFGMYATEILD
jgi:hypothetical protein